MSVIIFATVTIYERPSNDLKPVIARFLHSLLKGVLQLFHKLDIKLLWFLDCSFLATYGEESSLDNETGGSDTFAESPAEYLHYIAFKCGTKILGTHGVQCIKLAERDEFEVTALHHVSEIGYAWISIDGMTPSKPLVPAVLSQLTQFSVMNKLKKMAQFRRRPPATVQMMFLFTPILWTFFMLNGIWELLEW
ncbi:hypothetical protein E3N88_07255 [Mikania micrantha]|uniref:Uncharacterized protein n=1 Tax=Mikania micrantha TaxID=192012 RepID=A0A5N6PTX3_9ASTR|nr:hypothetical protein E3N88_07254 [Mikania micrantha]KAD6796359.1 hypothetical protein E3N88_07255 [Mikania micrantha]